LVTLGPSRRTGRVPLLREGDLFVPLTTHCRTAAKEFDMKRLILTTLTLAGGAFLGAALASPAQGGGRGTEISLKDLRDIMPALPPKKASEYLAPLNKALTEFGITTRKRQAAFLAQCAHESGELTALEEIPSKFGSSKSKYKGRGPLQV